MRRSLSCSLLALRTMTIVLSHGVKIFLQWLLSKESRLYCICNRKSRAIKRRLRFLVSPAIDIGSQTCSYSNLTSICDYGTALKEIPKDKQAVYASGNLNSRLFKAPYRDNDGNIYSLFEPIWHSD